MIRFHFLPLAGYSLKKNLLEFVSKPYLCCINTSKEVQKRLNYANPCPMMTKKQQSVAEQIAAEKQILHLQKMTDYRMRDYTIEELIDLYKTGRISDANLLANPQELSKFSWDETRQSLFIESLLIGLPVLPIFAVEASNGTFAVVDGMPRLTTLERFLGNQLILSHLNQLTLLNGFQFKDLPLSRQRRFKTREIRLVALTEKADLTVRQEILKRVWL